MNMGPPLVRANPSSDSLISPRLYARVIALLLCLGALKLALLFQSGRHLFEMHWRISPMPPSLLDQFNFVLFLVLCLVGMLHTDRICQGRPIQTLRVANVTFLGLGLVAVFLTFHEGDRNYLYPIMTDVLEWTSLGPYLSLNLFFRPPYLAAWMMVYAVVYYGLWRTHRERWSLRLTTITVAFFYLIYLGEYAESGPGLAFANCLGLAAVLAVRKRNKRLGATWFALPFVWSMLSLGIFVLNSQAGEIALGPYGSMLIGWTVVLLSGASLFAKRYGYLRSWLPFLPFYAFGFLFLTNRYYPLSDNLSNLLVHSLAFPVYFAGELMLVGLFALLLRVYDRLRPSGSLLWADAVSLALITLSFVDLRLLQTIGVRLDWNVFTLANSLQMTLRMARPYLPQLVLALVLMIGAYAGLLALLRAQAKRKGQLHSAATSCGGRFATAGILFIALFGSWLRPGDQARGTPLARIMESSPAWRGVAETRLSWDEFEQQSRHAKLFPSPNASSRAELTHSELNVVLILLESSYNKHLQLFGSEPKTQPLLSTYRDRMELFPFFFSNFAGSIHARFSLFTGLYPTPDFHLFTLNRVPVPSLFEILHDAGYSTSLFNSSFLDYTGFRQFLIQRKLDVVYDHDTMPGRRANAEVAWGLKEEVTLGAMQDYLRRQATNNAAFFMTYLPACPHNPFDSAPPEIEQFKIRKFGDYTPRYYNDLLYMDWIISSLLETLEELDLLDKTLVIITNDHGEMFGEDDGPVGHGWAVTPELANAPLIVMDPRKPGYRLNTTVGSLVDVLPSVLAKLGIALPPDHLYQGASLYSAHLSPERRIYINSHRQFAYVQDHAFTWQGEKPDAPSTPPLYQTYAFTNAGPKTIFREQEAGPRPEISKADFDALQEVFLRNYSYYHRQSALKSPTERTPEPSLP